MKIKRDSISAAKNKGGFAEKKHSASLPRLLQSAILTAREAVFLTDRQGMICFANPAANQKFFPPVKKYLDKDSV